MHNEIIAESGGAAGILNEGALESTLFKPRNIYHYEEDITLYKLAASYGYGLVKNHCFIDGNKRIALIAVYTFLAINGIELISSETDAAIFFLELAASFGKQEEDMNRLASWLQINSEPIND
ncbi:MAG: type II toxin-antitoxin system death-on-curing family toxin [Pseudanabaena sp.]|nr:MAG: type II toxin-antitoxin system death-on-curing family toxin [Pseudanabaena sp.]